MANEQLNLLERLVAVIQQDNYAVEKPEKNVVIMTINEVKIVLASDEQDPAFLSMRIHLNIAETDKMRLELLEIANEVMMGFKNVKVIVLNTEEVVVCTEQWFDVAPDLRLILARGTDLLGKATDEVAKRIFGTPEQGQDA